MDFIPVNEPLLNGNEKKYLYECIDTGWISSEGPFVKEFENKMSATVNRKYGIAVSNGTAALEVAAQALGIQKGDEVIMPAFTIISCAMAVTKLGAVPVLVDSSLDTWNMNVDEIEAKITSRTKAIMIVHIYGLPVDAEPILALAEKYNLKIIEDAAEMHGQTYKGDNYRFTNLQAAVGLAQLERLEEFVERKRTMGSYYTEKLRKIEGVTLPVEKTEYAENIYWVYGLLLKEDMQADNPEVQKLLAEEGIGSRTFFWCIHEQPVYRNMGLFLDETYPNAEYLARKGFYIPSGLAQYPEV